ncbi:OST-HTH/LOTUS domain-containing protein [Variovorax ureilyticus]|uniref:OST-HTH/LOTUS domain-containing protein n=1 Tax=Variovorax ureilyticus TaxID=1836198 RepID=UPI003D67DBD0
MTNEIAAQPIAPPELTAPESVVVLQREVQRKLGRCLIRLQQYEQLMKALATHCQLAGPMDELEASKQKRAETVSRMTLGQLVNELSDTYLDVDPAARGANEVDWEAGDDKRIWFRAEVKLTLEPEEFEKVVAGLKALVDLRNQLVHHLLGSFNLWDEEGCRAADAHLTESYSVIDRHYAELRDWAFRMDESRKMSAQFMASSAYADFVLFGIHPNGTVEWPCSGIVRHLRTAETTLAKAGWVDLAEAIGHIVKIHPEHTPKRYGCSSWRHVLHECREFEVRRERSDDLKSGRTLFRSREGSP